MPEWGTYGSVGGPGGKPLVVLHISATYCIAGGCGGHPGKRRANPNRADLKGLRHGLWRCVVQRGGNPWADPAAAQWRTDTWLTKNVNRSHAGCFAFSPAA